jgi:hypothetical protein
VAFKLMCQHLDLSGLHKLSCTNKCPMGPSFVVIQLLQDPLLGWMMNNVGFVKLDVVHQHE